MPRVPAAGALASLHKGLPGQHHRRAPNPVRKRPRHRNRSRRGPLTGKGRGRGRNPGPARPQAPTHHHKPATQQPTGPPHQPAQPAPQPQGGNENPGDPDVFLTRDRLHDLLPGAAETPTARVAVPAHRKKKPVLLAHPQRPAGLPRPQSNPWTPGQSLSLTERRARRAPRLASPPSRPSGSLLLRSGRVSLVRGTTRSRGRG